MKCSLNVFSNVHIHNKKGVLNVQRTFRIEKNHVTIKVNINKINTMHQAFDLLIIIVLHCIIWFDHKTKHFNIILVRQIIRDTG